MGQTLEDVSNELDKRAMGTTVSVRSSQIDINLTSAAPSITLRPEGGTKDGIEVPATPTGVAAISTRLGAPVKFIEKVDPDLRQHILTTLLERNADTHLVRVTDAEVLDVRPQTIMFIEPRRLVDSLGRVVTDRAPVRDWVYDPNKELRVDVVVPTDLGRGWGGDPKINDLTGAGLTLTQKLRSPDQFCAPSVSLVLYRLACTNGMIIGNEADRIDARNNTVEGVLAELEQVADRMFRRAEAEIASFYELRTQPVAHPDQWLVRVGRERAVPASTIYRIIARLPEIEVPEDGWNEFHLVNLLTNEANREGVSQRARDALRMAGGRVIADHTERCPRCASSLASTN